MRISVALAIALILPMQPANAHICGVDRVVSDGTGVRVFFDPRLGGTASVHGEVGTTIPVFVLDGGCDLIVSRENGSLGVRGQVDVTIPGFPRQTNTEWITAMPAR